MAKAKSPSMPIVAIDDEEQILLGYDTALRMGGYNNLVCVSDPREVLEKIEASEPEMVILDLTMPHLSGEELLPQITEAHPQVPVVVVTGMDSAETAVNCIKSGAFDYLVKPVDDARLLTTVRKAVAYRDLARENRALQEGMLANGTPDMDAFEDIVTISPAMHSIFQYVSAIARSSEPVLVTGETGSGKELIAKSIHAASDRSGPFMATNVAGLDETAFSDTLFGHKKGAFTGADQPRKGLVELASGGTLLLDEIGDLSPGSQVKLLRLLQEREYMPLGSERLSRCEARIVVATNQDTQSAMDAGTLRRDLYYRLSTHRVHVPPLRERMEDLPLLLDHFLQLAATELTREKPEVPDELLTSLRSYTFPGNIREFRAMVYDALSRSTTASLAIEPFKAHMRMSRAESGTSASTSEDERTSPISFGKDLPKLNEMKSLLIQEALKRTGGNKTLAAEMIGITRQAITQRQKRQGTQPDG